MEWDFAENERIVIKYFEKMNENMLMIMHGDEACVDEPYHLKKSYAILDLLN